MTLSIVCTFASSWQPSVFALALPGNDQYLINNVRSDTFVTEMLERFFNASRFIALLITYWMLTGNGRFDGQQKYKEKYFY